MNIKQAEDVDVAADSDNDDNDDDGDGDNMKQRPREQQILMNRDLICILLYVRRYSEEFCRIIIIFLYADSVYSRTCDAYYTTYIHTTIIESSSASLHSAILYYYCLCM